VTGELAPYSATIAAALDEEAVLRRFVPKVKGVALHLKGRLPDSVDVEDLIQAGMMALLRVMRAGGEFPDFDRRAWRIAANAMIDEVRSTAMPSSAITRRVHAAAVAMRKAEARLGRKPSDAEMAAELGLTLDRYHRLLLDAALVRLVPLDETDETATDDDPVRKLERERVLAELVEAAGELPERERLVLSLYYERELNMDEVGAVLMMDKSTVCRLHGRALLALRARMLSWEPAHGMLADVIGD
jgi:RNA polymerase sigma factor for flagellar operon FliA